jgi:VWFA-related protein
VLDRGSRFVSTLAQDQFRVYEDGVPQAIRFFSREDQTATIGLVIDNSGSMQKKRGDVMAASLAFARASNPLDQLFVVHFNERVWMGLPVGMSFTSDVVTLARAVSQVDARGQTALYDAVGRGLEHLGGAANSRRVLVVISDGGDNSSSTQFKALLQHARQTDTVVFTIGLYDENTIDRNLRVLKQLAAETGGETFLPDTVQDAAKVLERIAHDIRNSYTIGYVPTNATRDGKYRTIRVSVNSRGREKPNVRVRAGYLAPSDAASREPSAR